MKLSIALSVLLCAVFATAAALPTPQANYEGPRVPGWNCSQHGPEIERDIYAGCNFFCINAWVHGEEVLNNCLSGCYGARGCSYTAPETGA
ncbi:hypothetical protein BJ508DRAFT_327950 [Ascobolus immersus RN42]|uniref:Uncharacterized protein n=1 Tax=Ascobolus immersus RN42 TaxID=1160509 RepID=A0A3N4I5F4_ASCIM|nr:hypothetical protein BJ508DRAFT_327950 [Ascobolus immersus RN42]